MLVSKRELVPARSDCYKSEPGLWISPAFCLAVWSLPFMLVLIMMTRSVLGCSHRTCTKAQQRLMLFSWTSRIMSDVDPSPYKGPGLRYFVIATGSCTQIQYAWKGNLDTNAYTQRIPSKDMCALGRKWPFDNWDSDWSEAPPSQGWLVTSRSCWKKHYIFSLETLEGTSICGILIFNFKTPELWKHISYVFNLPIYGYLLR